MADHHTTFQERNYCSLLKTDSQLLILQVCVESLKEQLKDNCRSLSILSSYFTLTDEQLQEIIKGILDEFPNCGYKRMTGFLFSHGFCVPQERIRGAMRIVDPEGVILTTMQLNTMHRRHYSVYSPLALWHVDTHHKLIR